MILREIKNLYTKYLPIIAFLCLLNFIAVSCSKPTNRVKNEDKKYLKLISLGDVERDEGNYKNAEKYYEEAKKYDNGAYLSIAYLYYNFIDKNEGEKKYKIAYDKGNSQAAYILGSIAYKKGNFNLAKEWYLKGIKKGDKFSNIDLGKLLISENKIDEAKKYLLKVEDGNDAEGIYYLMTIYYREKNKSKIHSLKEKMFGKNKMNGIDDEIMLKIDLMLGDENENKKFELINEADSLIRINKYEEAKKKYEKLLEYGFEGYYFLGNMYKFLDNNSEAMKYYEIAYKKGNMGMAAYKIGNIYEEENNKLEAKKWYQAGINAGNSQSASTLGMLEISEGNEEKAKKLFLRGIEQKNAEAILGMMGYYQKKGNDKKIKELAKKILEEKGLLYNSLNLNNIATKVFLYD